MNGSNKVVTKVMSEVLWTVSFVGMLVVVCVSEWVKYN